MYYKYLLPLCDLPFNSYNRVFWLTEVHILKYYNELILFACGSYICVLRNAYPKDTKILYSLLEALFHIRSYNLTGIVIWLCEIGIVFFFFLYEFSINTAPFILYLLFQSVPLSIYCVNTCSGRFLDSVFCFIGLFIYPWVNITCLNYCSFIRIIHSCLCKYSKLTLLLQPWLFEALTY